MHARHHAPGNTTRSNSAGLGGVAFGRIPFEGSMRMHRMYNSEYRYSRGFGRGRPKPQMLLQQPCRGDVFVEAGRLAAEYLVSQGVLPPNVLPGKWCNGSLKNQSRDFLEFKAKEKENMQLRSEGRTSALARLGDVVLDEVSGRRRPPNEFNMTGLKNPIRGRKRMGVFRGSTSDWARENGRNSALFSLSRVPSDEEGEDHVVTGSYEDPQSGLDANNGTFNFVNNELSSKVDIAAESEYEPANYDFPEGSTDASSVNTRKELPRIEAESSKSSDDAEVSNLVSEEVEDAINDDAPQEPSLVENVPSYHQQMNGGTLGKNCNDLARLCSFANMPTRTRSSLTCKASKVEPIPIVDRSTSEVLCEEGLKSQSVESLADISSCGISKNQTHSPNSLGIDISGTPTIQTLEDDGDLVTASATKQEECMVLQSFPDKSVAIEQPLNRGHSGIEGCFPLVKDRGEKRAVSSEEIGGVTKKAREWDSSVVDQAHGDLHLHNFDLKASDLAERSLSPNEVVNDIDQEKAISVAVCPNSGLKSSVEYREEKQLFPSSFKICDLNLMESSDVSDNHEKSLIPGMPSNLEDKRKVPVDVGLSISNNCSGCNDYVRHSAEHEEVVAVDLECDSTKADEEFDSSERKTEAVHSTMEGFPSHMTGTSDLPDAQDGYGLMISELLGTDISNCSTVPAEIAGLHTDISLHNETGILGDDDPIYLSLGEIPISFLGVWDQPTQQYGKPF
ncbi:hypothetical protein Syun_003713 [Stephania yunnanensis]|uniref:Uncharacterized protein n=1 Tax=Stephania yunnanensis TaxID=152371 RepID=A0AAP0L1Y8_9MAGN